MKNNKSRNRERRTKSYPADATISVRLQLPRRSVDQMKDLERSKRVSKEEIFLRGLQACSNQ